MAVDRPEPIRPDAHRVRPGAHGVGASAGGSRDSGTHCPEPRRAYERPSERARKPHLVQKHGCLYTPGQNSATSGAKESHTQGKGKAASTTTEHLDVRGGVAQGYRKAAGVAIRLPHAGEATTAPFPWHRPFAVLRRDLLWRRLAMVTGRYTPSGRHMPGNLIRGSIQWQK